MSPKHAPSKNNEKPDPTSNPKAEGGSDVAESRKDAEPTVKKQTSGAKSGSRRGGATKTAASLVEAGDGPAVVKYAVAMEDTVERTASNAARVVQEVCNLKPELVVSQVERFARLLGSPNARVVQTCASALPPLARIAPAKVAKQLPTLTANWERTNAVGKDGLVRVFSGLCAASVAYQKRLEPALGRALREADPKTLFMWTEVVLPALKGEPHARARAVVEERLNNIPRVHAQKIADFLGVKLRPLIR